MEKDNNRSAFINVILRRSRRIYCHSEAQPKNLILGAALVLIAVAVVLFSGAADLNAAVDSTVTYPPECVGCHETQEYRNTPQQVQCDGTCHPTSIVTMTTGSHRTHINATSGRGPDPALLCSDCHGIGANPVDGGTHEGHMNGLKNFREGAKVTLTQTTKCAECHSPNGINGVNSTSGSVGAKDNWSTGVYSGDSLASGKAKWCVGCHDAAGSTIGGQTAKNIAGDDVSYGFFVSGHGLPAGSKYDGKEVGTADGNSGAGKVCTDCHAADGSGDPAHDHIDGVDGTGTKQRIKVGVGSAGVNGTDTTVLQDVCRNCHQTTYGSPANLKVSSHGNDDSNSVGNGYSKIEEYFSVGCLRCHDPHSAQLNNATATPTRNLKMIRAALWVTSNTTAPVVFKSRGTDVLATATDSFDEFDSEDSTTAGNEDDLCVTCHVNPNTPNKPMNMHFGAYGHSGPPEDRRGLTCTQCHKHNYPSATDTVYLNNDGFMPSSALVCGDCHPVYMTDNRSPTRWDPAIGMGVLGANGGAHQTHFRYFYTKNQPWGGDTETTNTRSLKGPGILVCDVCHGLGAGDTGGFTDSRHHPGHQNGVPNLAAISENTSDTTTLAGTPICNNCHSPGGAYNGVDSSGTSVGAKQNWMNGSGGTPIYGKSVSTMTVGKERWCVGCHDGNPADSQNLPSRIARVVDNQDNTITSSNTMTAPNMAGNGATYGAHVNGHSRPTASGSYDGTSVGMGGGNAAANKGCDACHNLSLQHLNTTNDTSMAGQRIDFVNNTSIAALATPDMVCKACHQKTGSPDSSTKQVSDHGNTGEGYSKIETDSTMAPIVCTRCHEGHGLNLNTSTTPGRNLRMINATIVVTTSPNTTRAIVFEQTTGVNSLDESDAIGGAADNDDLCATCHVYYGMKLNVGGRHNDTNSASVFYGQPTYAEKRGRNCVACHTHNYKGPSSSTTEANAFMPEAQAGACALQEGCHAFTTADQKNGSHETHFRYQDTGDATSIKGPGIYTCDGCHEQGSGTGSHLGHSNGIKNFETSVTSLSVTTMCNNCHSPGGAFNGVSDTTPIGVKYPGNWTNGVYSTTTTLRSGKEKWCVGCHDASPSFMVSPDATGTTMTAPNIGGNDTTYGAYRSGHSATTAVNYDATSSGGGTAGGNKGAGKGCEKCHDFGAAHINSTDNVDITGQRIRTTINARTVTSVVGACKNCHQYITGGDEASGTGGQVSDHGNAGEGYTAIETATMSGVGCHNCHEVHGSNLNSNNKRNLKMIRSDVRITTGTTASVVFERNTGGTRSFDDSAAPAGQNICATCHSNTNNPGYPMRYWTGGNHDTNDASSIFYGATAVMKDKRNEDCRNCHKHNYKSGAVDATNAFMPAWSTCVGSSGCHGYKTLQTDPAAQGSGSHITHFRYQDTSNTTKGAQSLKGPGLTDAIGQPCDNCHPLNSTNGSHEGHYNFQVNFDNSQTVLSGATTCNTCHSSGGGLDGTTNTQPWGARYPGNWANGVYDTSVALKSGKEKWCAGCHDNAPSRIYVVGSPSQTMTAPAVAGNDSAYGAYVSGHNLTTTANYDATTTMQGGAGNPGAGKECDKCHDFGAQHLDTTDNVDLTGQRIKTTINNRSVTSVAGACKACHQNSGPDEATYTQVSDHGNTGEGYSKIETATMSPVGCNKCHELHGNNSNTSTTPKRNLRMIRSDVIITTGTTAPVVFERVSGADSFDSNDATDANDICATCHGNSANPGYPMKRHQGGNHSTDDTSSVFFDATATISEKRGGDCRDCHKHNYKEGEADDTTVAEDNAFMPTVYSGTCAAGQACHGYETSGTKGQSAGAHITHLDNTQSASNKGPRLTTCVTCHGAGADGGTQTGHYNGSVTFSGDTTLGPTTVCNGCHSPGGGFNGVNDPTVGAKAPGNWKFRVYEAGSETTLAGGKEKWCVGCHDSQPSTITVGGQPRTAPDIGGDNVNYGAYVTGHSKESGLYYEDSGTTSGGNNAANKRCEKCHDLSMQHLNTVNDSDTAGQRIRAIINGTDTSASILVVCQNCHTYERDAGSDDAANANKVSRHGNSQAGGYSTPIEATFTVPTCAACHELHGASLNASGTPNLKMIRRDVKISETTGTTGDVIFTARTGVNSFDEIDNTATENNDDICATCHVNSNNPGYKMVNHVGGNDHQGGADNREKDCTSCHKHNRSDDTTTTVDDAFTPQGGACGSCHPAWQSDVAWQTGHGSHQSHFRYYWILSQPDATKALRGPGILLCDTCHGVGAGNTNTSDTGPNHHAGHQNGTKNFGDGTTTPLASTTICDDCHSKNGLYNGVTDTVAWGAKGNWYGGVYETNNSSLTPGKEKWCVACHDNVPSVIVGVVNDPASSDPTGTATQTVTAINIVGNDTTYGFYKSGHGLATTSTYDATTAMQPGGAGNAGAGKKCEICHNLQLQHLNQYNDTSMAGQRINSINGVSIGATASATAACAACHQNTGGESASTTGQVSEHGNEGEGYSRIETATMNPVGCAQCHELHGGNLNTNNKRNLKMVRSDVLVTSGTTAPVVFEKNTGGTGSFDESDTDPNDNNDICAACHRNANNPGYGMRYWNGGNHSTNDASSIFYQAPQIMKDKRAGDCRVCHKHNYKSGEATPANAFMPAFYAGTCITDGCHGATNSQQTRGRHPRHLNDTSPTKGPDGVICDTCHGIDAINGNQNGHYNYVVTFESSTTLSATTACNSCHSPLGGYNGVGDTTYGIGAIYNWTNGVYQSDSTLAAGKERWCVGCHDSQPSTMTVQATPRTAPDVGGDSTAYGAYVSGHSRPSTSSAYDESGINLGGGNAPAGKECVKCHNLATQHLDTINSTDATTGQRLRGTINGTSTGGTHIGICRTCHTFENDNGTDDASDNNKVAEHGNVDFDDKAETTFTLGSCSVCHELHGASLNSGGIRNLKMIRRDVRINESLGTTGNVVYTSRTDTDSLDEGNEGTTTADNNDDLCAVCHSNPDNPGYPMTNHVGGNDHIDNPQDRRGTNCMQCHKHRQSTNTMKEDAFMPACTACHGYPPISPEDNQESPATGKEKVQDYTYGGGAHRRHYTQLGWPCARCHAVDTAMTDASPQLSKVVVEFDTNTPLGFAGGTTMNNSDTSPANAVHTKSTTTPPAPGFCRVGCHNPRVFKPASKPTTVGLDNVATWTVRGIPCYRCHNYQQAAADRQQLWVTDTSNTSYYPATYISGHSKLQATDATEVGTGYSINRKDCLRCHYVASGVTSDDGTHTEGTVTVRSAEATGTALVWGSASNGTTPTQVTQESLCLSCHDADGMPTNWRFSESTVNTESLDIEQYWGTNTANYTAHRTAGSSWIYGKGCVGTGGKLGTGCHEVAHGSAKPKLLGPSNVSKYEEEQVCFGCHNNGDDGYPSLGGNAGKIKGQMNYYFNDTTATYLVTVSNNLVSAVGGTVFDNSMINYWFRAREDAEWAYTKVTAVTATQLTLSENYLGGNKGSGVSFYLRARRISHPIGEQANRHTSLISESTSAGYGWNSGDISVAVDKRHVECTDCHNVHAAQPGTHQEGTNTLAPAQYGVWGVDASYSAVYNLGGARFREGSITVDGGTLFSETPNWSSITPGYRIKNNYDKSGRWYTVVAVNSSTQLRIAPAWTGALTNDYAENNYVDYTLAKVTYTKVAKPTKYQQVCLKCHSSFAYGSNNGQGTDTPPITPSGMYNAVPAPITVRQTEIGMDYNPNQFAYHPIWARGKNQPISVTGSQNSTSSWNSNWPRFAPTSATVSLNTATPAEATFSVGTNLPRTIVPGWFLKVGTSNPPANRAVQNNWFQVLTIISTNSPARIEVTPTPSAATSTAPFTLTAGLGNAFVRPFGPWALLACSDCHRSELAEDAHGPHGANHKWMDREATTAISFEWMYDTDGVNVTNPEIVTVNYNQQVSGETTGAAGWFTTENFCYNCHRRDVYGDFGMKGIIDNDTWESPAVDTGYMGRVPHDVTANSNTYGNKTQSRARWGDSPTAGPLCMMCHTGDSLGSMHGTTARKSVINIGKGGAGYVGGAGVGNDNRGERFLNGATWYAVSRATTLTGTSCYLKVASDEVAICAQGHNPSTSGQTANYDY